MDDNLLINGIYWDYTPFCYITFWDILVSHETWNSASMMRPQHAVSLISIGPSSRTSLTATLMASFTSNLRDLPMSPLNYQKKRPSLSQPEEKYRIGSTKRSSSSPAKYKVLKTKIKGPSCCFVYRPNKIMRFFSLRSCGLHDFNLIFQDTKLLLTGQNWFGARGYPLLRARWALNRSLQMELWGPYKWPYK